MKKKSILALLLVVCMPLAGCQGNRPDPKATASQKPTSDSLTTSQTPITTAPSQSEEDMVPVAPLPPEIENPVTTPPVEEPVVTPPAEEPVVTPPVEMPPPAKEPIVTPPTEEQPPTPPETTPSPDSNAPAVTVHPRLYWEGNTPKLAVTWTNSSSYSIEYGHGYSIQRLEGNQWVYPEYEGNDYVITLEAYELKSGCSIKKTYSLHYYLGIPGQYRFVSHYYVDDGNGRYQSHEVSAEFTLDWTEDDFRDLKTFEPTFTSRYLSTPAKTDDFQYPEATALYTTDQFWEYSLANESVFDLSEYHALWSEYSDNFFEDHYLIIIPLEGGADSVDNEVHLLQANYLGNHHVFIGRQYQDAGSSAWHIILEVEKPERSSFPRGPYVQTTLF